MHSKKTIWITGASSGIGQGLAQAFIEQGHFVIVSGRNRQALSELETMAPQRVRPLEFDLSEQDFSLALPARLREHTDTIDMVILAAGVCEYVDRPNCGLDLYRRVMEVNFFAQVECARIALSFLRNSELRPQIVGVGSLAAHLPFPGQKPMVRQRRHLNIGWTLCASIWFQQILMSPWYRQALLIHR